MSVDGENESAIILLKLLLPRLLVRCGESLRGSQEITATSRQEYPLHTWGENPRVTAYYLGNVLALTVSHYP